MKYFIYCRKSTDTEDKQIQSLEDQEKVLKDIALKRNLDIVEILRESKSAKAPGRPVFDHMLEQIHKGVAQGILCWKLDRLARNPVDGGAINWMLQQGVIQKIVTNDRDYQPTDNVLMMSFEFGTANQFILDLGKNTKRGMQSKCEKGWFPGVASQGYLNNKGEDKMQKWIIKDELRFPLIRKMWDLMITGQYSVQKICDIANTKWGYKTPQKRCIGGVRLNLSTLYSIFNNPFYYGEFYWDNRLWKGSHEPMITKAEFDHVQRMLGKKGKPIKTVKQFALTGLINCGECGCQITSEEKTKYIQSTKEVRHYIYYHCTHKRKDYKCKQKSLEKNELERQVLNFLDTFTIEDEFIEWIIKYLKEYNDKECFDRTGIANSVKTQLSVCENKLDNLIRLKISDLITDDEFKRQKEGLILEKGGLLEEINNLSERQNNWIGSAERAVDFLKCVKIRFKEGSIEDKKLILSTLGSNLVLKDGKLSVQANGVYESLQKGIIQTKELGIRLEPTKGRLDTRKKAHQEALYPIWYPRRESNLRPTA